MLEYLLSTHLRDDLPRLTKTWQIIRKPRVERIKDFARWNADAFKGESTPLDQGKLDRRKSPDDQDVGQVRSLKTVKPDASAKFSSATFLKWVLDHDAVNEVRLLSITM